MIEKKNEEIDGVKKTVTEELKSYSSVLQNTCTAALAPRNIVSAVKTVKAEDDRSRNLLVFGIEKKDGVCGRLNTDTTCQVQTSE